MLSVHRTHTVTGELEPVSQIFSSLTFLDALVRLRTGWGEYPYALRVFPSRSGGLESHVRYLCRSLVRRGHQVNVVTSLSQPGLPQHQMIDGISVWRTWIPGRNTFGWATYAVCSTPKLVALGQNADVLHAQDIASVLPCIIAKRRRKIPIVTTYHTSHFLKRAKSLFWRPVFRTFLRMADHNLAASAEIASVGKNIAPQVDVEPLTNGVDTSIFGELTHPPSS